MDYFNTVVYKNPCDKCGGKVILKKKRNEYGFINIESWSCDRCGKKFKGYNCKEDDMGNTISWEWIEDDDNG